MLLPNEQETLEETLGSQLRSRPDSLVGQGLQGRQIYQDKKVVRLLSFVPSPGDDCPQ